MKKARTSEFDSPLWRDKEMGAHALGEMASLAEAARSATGKDVAIMEVCGTHTMAIAASGIRRLLPKGLKMLSGPGCPVCVTAQGDIDLILELAVLPNVIIATFGDMLKVKGSKGRDLHSMRETGSDVRIVYSPIDALDIALAEPGKEIVFVGVGFETTAPLIAGTVLRAAKENIRNFSVIALFKLVPPALEVLLTDPGRNISGFMLPGHVSAIIGIAPYRFVAEKYSVPCAITGFEPIDIVAGINMILKQIVDRSPVIATEYSRAVRTDGNQHAVHIMEEVFEVVDAHWRSIGMIKGSGLGFRSKFSRFDAMKRFKLKRRAAPEPPGCICGKILLGKAEPRDCKLFGKACTPANAVGPCMVSSEGACAAWFKYGG